MKIYEKLLTIQAELKAPKSQYNSFGKYKYRNCEDILEALKPILAKVKATLIISDDIVNMADRFYVKATARLIDTESGEHLETTAYAREEETKKGMDGSQVTGASSSYARKYALNGLFAIDDTKDSDYSPEQKPVAKKPQSNLAEAKLQLKKLMVEYSKISNKPMPEIIDELKGVVKKDLQSIDENEAKTLITYTKGKIAKKNSIN